MRHEIRYGPSYSLGIIVLDPGESIQAEAGAMVSMSDTIEMQTSAGGGGVLSGLKRAALGGESFFVNTFTASGLGEITIAPPLPGDMMALEMRGETIFVQSGSFLAASPTIQIDTKWGGARSFFSGEGFFLLRCTGHGTLWLSSYGAIHGLQLGPSQRYTVDTGHMVAFDESVTYEIGKAAQGWKSTILGGEGLVVKLTGPGRFYLQTRSPGGFVGWLVPQLPFERT